MLPPFSVPVIPKYEGSLEPCLNKRFASQSPSGFSFAELAEGLDSLFGRNDGVGTLLIDGIWYARHPEQSEGSLELCLNKRFLSSFEMTESNTITYQIINLINIPKFHFNTITFSSKTGKPVLPTKSISQKLIRQLTKFPLTGAATPYTVKVFAPSILSSKELTPLKP